MARLWSRISNSPKLAFAVGPAAASAVLLEAYLRTATADAELPAQCKFRPASSVLTSAHVLTLERDGYVILQHVLRPDQLAAARSDVTSLVRSKGRFAMPDDSGEARQDLVTWLREDRAIEPPLGDGILHCMRLLRGLAFELDALGYSTSHDLKVPKQLQLAMYPGDSSSEYVRHFDSINSTWREVGLLQWLRDSDIRERAVTALLYLNDTEWKAAAHHRLPGEGHGGGDGGELRLYHGNSNTDVTPRGGTLVIFDSRRIEHQVLPSRRARFALTVWIIGKPGKTGEAKLLE